MEIVTSRQMQRIDSHAIRTLRIASRSLMEAAGSAVVEAIAARYSDLQNRRILVVCGKGNNGGDGLVVARRLRGLGLEPEAWVLAGPRDLRADARANLTAAIGAEVSVTHAPTPAAWARLRRRLREFDLIVDALLGTGLTEPARGLVGRAIRELARGSRAPIVAIDLPSGLSGDSSSILDPSLRADLTVALCRPKIAHLLPPACLACGTVRIAGIGIPDRSVASVHPALATIEANEVARHAARRPRDAHKGDFGHVLIVGGSEGKAGAPALAARAALRSGAGLVTLAAPAAVRAEAAGHSPEVMSAGIPSGSPDAIAAWLQAQARGKSAIGLGPGLGREPEVAAWIRAFVLANRLPLVLDADGLNAFEGMARRLARARGTLILTPHPGEAARLLGTTSDGIVGDRLAAARALAKLTRAIVVLKGMASLVATPTGPVFVNTTGNPGMATGGAGDVLTGLLAGCLAQGLEPEKAARIAVHAHGRAGDLAAEAFGEIGLIAGDLIEQIPRAYRNP